MILDEFQLLAAQEPGLGDIIDRWWQAAVARNLPIVLVLAGSDMGFFEREVLGNEQYGGRPRQRLLQPLHFRDAARFHTRYSPEDRVRTFAICGGMPYYLERFTDDAPLWHQILRHALYRDGILFHEAELLLRQALPDPRNHMSVLRAIAQGQTQNNQVAQRTRLSESQVTQIVAALERMRLVRTVRPVTAQRRSKKTRYEIRDPFLNFYFRFIDAARSRLRGRPQAESYLREVVLPQLDHFVAATAWQQIARDYVREHEEAAAVGRWWGQVPTGEARRTRAQGIDVVALGREGAVFALGTCDWTRATLGRSEAALLTTTEPLIPGATAVRRHYFFSRSGFAAELQRLAAADPDRYRLVTPADVYA